MAIGRVVILGGGESGVGAAVLAKRKGYDVFLSDRGALSDSYKQVLEQEAIAFEEGQHTQESIFNANIIVKSPGIPDHIEMIQELKSKGIEVISEIEWAYRFTEGKIVAITGSNGKTTTTSWIGHLFMKAELDVAIVGNIGKSFAMQVAEQDKEYYVIEVSSFQLDGITSFKPDVAVLLNISPDHLDRYDYKFENYIDSKFRITMNQTEEDHFVYCFDDEAIQKHIGNYGIKAKQIPFSFNEQFENGAWVEAEQIFIQLNKLVFGMSINELSLSGRHNVYNSMASSIVGRIFDIKKATIRESMMNFKNLEHRLEFVAKIKGIEFINDSKATNVNSTWYALESMDKPTIWIVGGVDKGNDYEALVDLVNDKVKAIVCIGEDTLKIHSAFAKSVDLIVNTNSMDEAVTLSNHLGAEGDTVLLSPACASFDMFENYEDRGMRFKHAVRSI